MNKILGTLVIAAVLSSATAFAEDTLRVSMQNGKQRVDFSLNGNDRCVTIDDKIHCDAKGAGPRGLLRVQLSQNSSRLWP